MLNSVKTYSLFLVLGLVLTSGLGEANARGRFGGRQPIGQPGQFDLYVFSMSWSPAFCATKPEHVVTRIQQCQWREGFVMHGLWPQAETGSNPQYCAPSKGVRGEDVMPVKAGKLRMPESLWNHEWSKHGTCSGLTTAGYFEAAAAAAARVQIPPVLEALSAPMHESVEAIEGLFINSNPGLTPEMVEVKVDRGGRVYEVVICMTKQLEFTSCKNIRLSAPGTRGVLLPPGKAFVD